MNEEEFFLGVARCPRKDGGEWAVVGIIAKEMKRGESMRTHFYALLPTFCTGMGCNDAVAAPAPGLCSTRRCVRRGVVETGIGFGHQVAAGWFVAVHSQKEKNAKRGARSKMDIIS